MIDPTYLSSSDPAVPLQESWNYEVAVAQVEAIVARIEAGELELEEVFEQFAAAVEYLHQCETFLQQRQQQVDLLIETLKDEPQF
jgi:exodeoxyribonuclease VII small subunit